MSKQGKPGRVPEWFERGRIRWAWGGWEPPSFYLRAGSLSGGVDGRALWAPRWWEHLHSEKHVAAMAEIGINLVTTHYYKGFGLEFEAEEMERTRKLVELYHQYGIHVLGYCQYTTVYPEALMDEVPDLAEHVQYAPDGSKRLYGGSGYFRWQWDLTSPVFMEYLKRVVSNGLENIGLDGVEWDGTVFSCYCDRCTEVFRQYLRDSYAGREYELFGLPHFDHALPAPQISSSDPMYHAWHEFRVDQMHGTLRELYGHAKSVREDAVFATYPPAPGLTRPDRDRIMPWSGDYLDLATSECHEMPRVTEDGRLVCAMRHLKQCTAIGVPSFVTAWIVPDSGGYRAPETANEVKLSIAESAVYGGHPFPATWANRPLGTDGKALYQDPARGGALKSYMNFFRDNEELYAGSTPLANVGVYYSLASVDYDREGALRSLQGIEQIMLQNQIPFRIYMGMPEDEVFDTDLVCIANQRLMSNVEGHAFRNHVAADGGLVITGETGSYDENRRGRADDVLAGMGTHAKVTRLEGFPEACEAGPEGRVSPLHPYLPAKHREVAAAIAAGAPRGLAVEVRADAYVGVDLWRTADGRVAVHLINYNNQAGPTTVSLRPATWLNADVNRLELLTPDDDTAVQTRDDGSVVVTGLASYAAVVIG